MLNETDYSVKLKFGGGINTRSAEDEIDSKECTDGKNFALDIDIPTYKNRKPFDYLGTAPNNSEIRGFASLYTADGTVSLLVQAGNTVYEWDGSSFTSKGSCSASSRLRGRLEHNWQLTGKVLITDLELLQPVMEWDGTTLQNVTFTDETLSGAFGEFRARYCSVTNERAVFGNIYDNGTTYPHLIVGSLRGDYTIITVANRPSSALNEGDPFFLVQPDNRAINGLVQAYGQTVTSSKEASMFILSGDTAKDFIMKELYSRSGVSGNESLAYVGNDIVYGRQNAIESLKSTEKYGDVEADDLSLAIADEIDGFSDWTIAYNARNKRIYCVPGNSQAQLWVLHKTMIATGLSPWAKWVTDHQMSFNPSTIMNVIDPSDGLEYVFMGDSNGNMYRLEGTGTSGDGGGHNVVTERLSRLFTVPVNAQIYDIKGYIKYKRGEAATVELTFEYNGMSVFDETITVNLPARTFGALYGGGSYYSGGAYYGSSFSGRLSRQIFGIAGKSSEIQVRAKIEGTTDFEITEIGLEFSAAS